MREGHICEVMSSEGLLHVTRVSRVVHFFPISVQRTLFKATKRKIMFVWNWNWKVEALQ